MWPGRRHTAVARIRLPSNPLPLPAWALTTRTLRARHRMSTYQAMQAGASLDAKKRTGKKCFNPNAIPGASPLHGGAGFGMASGLRADPLTALEVGGDVH